MQKFNPLHLGHRVDHNKSVDEVMVSILKFPESSTGENTIGISSHGSLDPNLKGRSRFVQKSKDIDCNASFNQISKVFNFRRIKKLKIEKF